MTLMILSIEKADGTTAPSFAETSMAVGVGGLNEYQDAAVAMRRTGILKTGLTSMILVLQLPSAVVYHPCYMNF